MKTTLNTYSHLYPDKDQQLADRLNQFRRARCQQKKSLETTCGLWYIEHKEGHLLVTGVPQELPIDG